MIGVELVKNKATREPATALRNRVETLAFERGLLILGCGETTLRLCPPLVVNEREAIESRSTSWKMRSPTRRAEHAHANELAASRA